MGLEVLKEEIIRNANLEKEKLLAEAKTEAEKIMKDSKKKFMEFKMNAESETKRILDTLNRQEQASAELESKKMILEAKKGNIDKVFLEIKKKIEKLEPKIRESYIKRLLEKAKKDIEVEKVYCNKKDIEFVKESKVEAADIIGGLIAENKDGIVRVDYSFDIMLQSITENELQNINEILFE